LTSGGDARFERTFHECFERQGIEFSDKTHTGNVSNYEEKSSLWVDIW
jgi:hypothetical protein